MTIVTMGIVILATVTLAIVGCPEEPLPTEPLGESETSTDESFDGTSGVGDGDGDDDGGNYGITDTDHFGDSTDMEDMCGDFAVQIGEECDGWNTAFESCKT